MREKKIREIEKQIAAPEHAPPLESMIDFCMRNSQC